jgi:hypothetical protein
MPRAVAAGRRLYLSGSLARVGDAPGMISAVGKELHSDV